ncbi:hypothetical protein VRRI112168_16250 [Vreelandella rituensis]
MAQALLQGHRTDLGQERGVRLLFQLGQESAGIVVADLFLTLIERIGAIAQHCVPDKPHAPKRPRQQDFLLGRGVESGFVGAFGFHGLQLSIICVRTQGVLSDAALVSPSFALRDSGRGITRF